MYDECGRSNVYIDDTAAEDPTQKITRIKEFICGYMDGELILYNRSSMDIMAYTTHNKTRVKFKVNNWRCGNLPQEEIAVVKEFFNKIVTEEKDNG